MISVVGTLNKTNAIQPLRYVLDGYEDHSFTLNGTLLSSRTLYTSPVLTPGNHSLVVTLMSNATALILDGTFIMANSTEGTKGKINHIPEIVGGTAGGVVFILLLLVLFFLHRLRRRNTGLSHVPLKFMPLNSLRHSKFLAPLALYRRLSRCQKKRLHRENTVTTEYLSPFLHLHLRILSLLCRRSLELATGTVLRPRVWSHERQGQPWAAYLSFFHLHPLFC